MIIGLGLVLMLLLNTFDNRIEIPYSTFVKLIDTNSDNIKKLSFGTNDRIFGEIGSPDKLPTTAPSKEETKELEELKERFEKKRATKFVTRRWPFQFDPDLTKTLDNLIKTKNLKVDAPEDPYAWVGPLMLFLLPAILLLGVFIFLVPRFRDPLGGNFLNSYVKSPARRYERGKQRITFEDVAGMQNAKGELQEVVEFLKTPEKFQKLGAQVPRGVLLVGPPGTGKTLLAKAVAGEAGVPFFSINGSEFIQMFVGVGASRVRDLFKNARENAPCLVGETFVTLSGGRQVKIEDMYQQAMVGVRVPAMTADFHLADATVLAITRKPCPNLYRITTTTSNIKATGNHLFPVLRDNGMEWVEADQLKEGDYVAVPRRIPTTDPAPSFSSFLPVHPSRKSLQGVVAEIEDWRESHDAEPTEELERLKDLAHSDILWSRIQRVEQIPTVDYVYDLCLDRHNCFVANNLIVHNCIIFVDEIDAVGRMRGAGVGGGSDEREQTLNQILSEMDGFSPTETVIVVAATNRPDVLDPALLRPGRFDRHITIDRPTWQGRLAILKIHTRNKPLSDEVELESIARSSTGMTGADLRNLANEAALLATREGKNHIDQHDFARAYDRVLMGPIREEVLGLEGRRRTAYHESGHTLVGWLEPNADPPQKVTIVPRGQALGVTLIPPDEDRMHHGLDYWKAKLAFIMGGRAADRLMYKQAFSGHENDLKQATKLARYMITHWGMSDRLGPMSFRVGEEHVFLGKELQEQRDFSEGIANVIDEEVQKLLREADERAYSLLEQNRDKLEALVEALLEREELLRDEIEKVLRGEKLPPLERLPPKKEPPAQSSFSPDGSRAVSEA
jgi:ATP-dependent metalloprotease FtsH